MQNSVNPKLTKEQQRILFEGGTEAPGTGEFVDHNESGMYTCANCGSKLFESDTKYVSTTPGLVGWPSFEDAIEGAVEFKPDNSLGMKRTEVVCANCGGHLGHVFDEAHDGDGTSKSGKHYCINSCVLGFEKK
mgnify:CR=1 FL=1